MTEKTGSLSGSSGLAYILPVVALVDVALAVAVVLLLGLPLWTLALAIPIAWTDTLVIGYFLRKANAAG